MTSPDGRFRVAATNDGIVLSGPAGSATFDGEELLSDGDLEITTPLGLALTNGTVLNVTSGATTSFATAASFTQSVGGTFTQNVTSAYEQNLGTSYTQNVGKAFTQTVGGTFDQAAGTIKQRATTLFDAKSGSTANLSGANVNITAASCSKIKGGPDTANIC